MKVSKYLYALFFKCAVLGLGVIPMPLLYVLSDALAPLMRLYRRKVVRRNLENAFPEWDPKKRRAVERTFYRHFTDNLLESIKGFTMSEAALQKHFRFLNPELIYDRPGSDPCFIVGGHFFNWEWGITAMSSNIRHPIVCGYKPLKNEYIDRWLAKYRARKNMHLVPSKSVVRAVITGKTKRKYRVFALIADQSPFRTHNAYWLDFFHRETPFLPGPEKIARAQGLPLYYYSIRRIKRGQYSVRFIPLHLSPASSSDGEITAKFRDLLEADIRADPTCWLWTHKRWKRAKESQ